MKEPDKDEQFDDILKEDAQKHTEDKLMDGISRESVDDVGKDVETPTKSDPAAKSNDNASKSGKEPKDTDNIVEIHENEEVDI